MLDLGPIKARLAAATPGPWEAMPSKNKGGVDKFVGPPGCDFPVCEMFVIWEKWGDDMYLIANAPTDLAALVEEVERLREQVEHNKATMLPILEEVARLKRQREVSQAQLRSYTKALQWYADPANWKEQVDDRGRDTLRFRWADDDGHMARHALSTWRQSEGARKA
jgi:radical SAM superfamily enzyme YgiQ (UPF0313 family)